MLRITDRETEKKLRELRKENPNYDAMWSRIRLEADKRESGWQEQDAMLIKKTAGRQKWIFSGSLLLVGVIALSIVIGPPGSMQPETNKAYGAPAGQKLDTSATTSKVTLKLDQAVSGHFEGIPTYEDQPNKLTLQMSLGGIEASTNQYAAFKTGTLTDLDSGRSEEFTTNAFDLGKGLQGTQEFEDEWVAEGEIRHFRLEMKDLYVLQRKSVPLSGAIKKGSEYEVPSRKDMTLQLQSSEWIAEQQELSLKFKTHAAPIAPEYPMALSFYANDEIVLNHASQTITSFSGGSDKGEFENGFQIPGLDEQGIQDLTMSYIYAEMIQKVEGTWTVDFILDGSEVREHAAVVPVEDDSSVYDQAGWRVPQAKVGAYGVYLPIEREEDKKAPHDGQIVYYNKWTLVTGQFESTSGNHMGYPGELTLEQQAETPEYMFFDLYGTQIRDLQSEALSVKLEDAVVLNAVPEPWTELGKATESEQIQNISLPDQSKIEYRYVREGNDVKITTTTSDPIHLFFYNKLKVDGIVVEANEKESHGQTRLEVDQRIDIFKNIPKDAKLEIGLEFYGKSDPTLDAEIVIQN